RHLGVARRGQPGSGGGISEIEDRALVMRRMEVVVAGCRGARHPDLDDEQQNAEGALVLLQDHRSKPGRAMPVLASSYTIRIGIRNQSPSAGCDSQKQVAPTVLPSQRHAAG